MNGTGTVKKGLSGGAKALIAIGIVFGVIIAACAGVFIYFNSLYSNNLLTDNDPGFAPRPQSAGDPDDVPTLVSVTVKKDKGVYVNESDVSWDDVKVVGTYMKGGETYEAEITDYEIVKNGDTGVTVHVETKDENGNGSAANVSLSLKKYASAEEFPEDVSAEASSYASSSSSDADMIYSLSAKKLAAAKNASFSPIYNAEQTAGQNLALLLIETAPFADGDPVKSLVPEGRQKANSVFILVFDEKAGMIRIIALDPLTLVPVDGYGKNTLRNAYAIGGPGMLVNSVNDFYGTSIRYYLETNLDRIIEYADSLGGVKLDLTSRDLEAFSLEGLSAGSQTVKGSNAKKLLTADTRNSGGSALQQDYYEGMYRLALSAKSDYLGAITSFLSDKRVVTNMPMLTFASTAWSLKWIVGGKLGFDLTDVPSLEPGSCGYVTGGGTVIAAAVDKAAARETVLGIISGS